MQLSNGAQTILDQFAADQGLRQLAFDEDGLIPIQLGEDLFIAVGYNPANDIFFFLSVIDPDGDTALPDPWWAFARNQELAARRTRLAVEPSSKALMMITDTLVSGLQFPDFTSRLDAFVADVEKVRQAYGELATGGDGGDTLSALSNGDMIRV